MSIEGWGGLGNTLIECIKRRLKEATQGWYVPCFA